MAKWQPLIVATVSSPGEIHRQQARRLALRIEGCGKLVVREVEVRSRSDKQVLQTETEALAELNTCKNQIGSAMAGSVGRFFAHAANIVCLSKLVSVGCFQATAAAIV